MNLDHFKKLLIGQYDAAFSTLDAVIQQVPDTVWQGPVAKNTFDQSIFHTLFYADVYLSNDENVVAEQEFHQQHREVFDGYEEFTFDPPTKHYDLEFIKRYLKFCVAKSRQVVQDETDESLNHEAGHSWQTISRGELHVYNLRHIQHHAAQLILRLRLDTDIDIGWYKSGWKPWTG